MSAAGIASDDSRAPDRAPVLLLAVAGGLVVANLYYNQPLLAGIARDLGVTDARVAPVATLTQVGYALGLFAVVPLADVAERRRLLVLLVLGAAAALAAAALAPTAGALAAASLAVGVLSVAPQVIVPIAADLAAPGERGRVVGTVMSGLLVGILGARVASGALGARFGWRPVFWAAAGAMVGLAVVLRARLPASRTESRPGERALSYRELLASLPAVARRWGALRESALFGGLAFASFSVFWTTLPFHLADLPGHYGSGEAGAFGLVGIVGALAASFVGRINDRGDPRRTVGAGLLVTLGAWVTLAAFGRSLAGLVGGVLLLDLGVQGAHVSNQARIFALDEASRGRINAVYMVAYFAGGALGSAVGAAAWARAGWTGVAIAGAAFTALALAVFLRRRTARPDSERPDAAVAAAG